MDFSDVFEKEYFEMLDGIRDNFQANLSRHIQNDITRSIGDSTCTKEFLDVGFNMRASTILLEEVTLVNPVKFSAPVITCDLLKQYIGIEFDLADMNFEGKYSSITQGMFDMAISQYGKIRFALKNIKLTGSIGFYSNQDSLVPCNYDLNYNIKEIETKTISFKPTGQPCDYDCQHEITTPNTNIVTSSVIDNTLLGLIWIEFLQYINRHLERLISGNVVEFSFGEMFYDEPEQYKAYEEKRKKYGNEIFDKKMEDFKRVCLGSNQEAVQECPLKISFYVEDDIYQLVANTCRIDNLDLVRLTDASFYEEDGETVYCAQVALKDFTYILDNCVISTSTTKVEGSLKLSPDRHKFFVKFLNLKQAAENNYHVRLSLSDLDGVTITERQLGEHDERIYNDVMEKLEPYMLGHVRYYANNIINAFAKKFNERGHNREVC